MSQQEIIEVGKALLPYLRNNLSPGELGTAAHDAVAALNRARSGAVTIPRAQHEALMGAAKAIKQFAERSNWSEQVGCLQWMGKRAATDYADEILAALRAAGILEGE